MKQSWLKQKEHGSLILIKLISWIALNIGRSVARLLLYPICFYFILFSGKTRRASRSFLSATTGKPATLAMAFRHFHTFASTILDRVYLLGGRHDIFDINFFGLDVALNKVEKKQGLILLGSHLGSFEVLRAIGMSRIKTPINILIYEDNSKKISSVLNALNPAAASGIINLGKTDALLRVKERVDSGEIVGILGDRVTKGDKVVECGFMGKKAPFPWGPMLIASIVKVPVILFFGLYKGDKSYEIHFELFAEEVTIDRQNRQKDLAMWTQRYAERLEHFARLSPYNWFNFYDFWQKNEESVKQ